MFGRIYAIFQGRNREFLRDKASFAWNMLLPVILIFGLSFTLGGDRNAYTVGVLQDGEAIVEEQHPFLEMRYIRFVPIRDKDDALIKISRHQLDLLVEFGDAPRYWVNPDSAKGHFVELALLQSDSNTPARIEKEKITGDAIRYADWVLPGILGMNMMFSCMFGVGYVVVRYRKNGFLKRLRATPLSSFEFISAQVASRMVLITGITVVVFTATHIILDTRMEGSYFTLFLVAIVGAISMVSLGLVISARVTSEELAGGLLNMVNWPMMLLSGVWFSLEGAGPFLQNLAKVFPLTHVLDAARSVMLDGATLAEVAPSLGALTALSAVFIGIGARVFRWGPF
ncbi:MAG: ABC transporter permease [Gammaproteobacteria bacterium]|nr:ABC transporter permease [Gammaproteobacteria bacterium]MDH3364050.1 ABC transporter permease [Gammaproteobacteria bacterium]MDH3481887.1 ABC transporter permease [Gammaproteobacteria bacterium]